MPSIKFLEIWKDGDCIKSRSHFRSDLLIADAHRFARAYESINSQVQIYVYQGYRGHILYKISVEKQVS